MKETGNLDATAFPVPQDCVGDYEGLTKLEYFAAHAPAEIPEWFKHEWPAFAGASPRLPEEWSDKKRQRWSWAVENGGDEIEPPDDGDMVFRKLVHEQVEYAQQSREWRRKNEMARYIQWRYAYAEMMCNSERWGC